jgi:hypothetical protein
MANGLSRPGKALLSVVVILIAAFLISNFYYKWVDLKFFGGRENPALARDREVLAIDSLSGKVYVVEKKKGKNWPLKNPDTNKRTLWSAWICHDENILFPGKPRTLIESCPICGSPSVGGARVEQKDLQVKIPAYYEKKVRSAIMPGGRQ